MAVAYSAAGNLVRTFTGRLAMGSQKPSGEIPGGVNTYLVSLGDRTPQLGYRETLNTKRYLRGWGLSIPGTGLSECW